MSLYILLETVYNSTKSSPTRLTIDIKSNLKYRAPTPKNIMEGKYKSISPDSYYNESSKNNDMKDYGSKSNHSPKKGNYKIFIKTIKFSTNKIFNK